jgi:hypothetical protein
MTINKKPLWISFNIKNYHVSFGFYYKIELYLDETEEKLKVKSRKVGYKWFCALSKKRPIEYYKGLYDKMIAEWNNKKQECC